MTWEEAVRWYRGQPNNELAVRANYFDLPVSQAARRYAQSEEFAQILRLLGQGKGKSILDLGAGNGIASFAFAQACWHVTALDPDPSEEVGAGAIRSLSCEANLSINVVEEWGERLPFPDHTFDALHGRQVLHHARDLDVMLQEVARVTRPGALLLFTREHVADNAAQLAAFRTAHPLHHLYGGENAFPLPRYRQAFAEAGLRLRREWGPLESIINFSPGTEAQRQITVWCAACRSWYGLGTFLAWSAGFRSRQLKIATQRHCTPGRIFSFLLEKTC